MTVTKAILTIIVAVTFIVLGPIATIWSLNTLFPVLAIPFTFDTWLAAFVLFGAFIGARSRG